jgi:Fur family ferric uptake transcriptional regulator
MKNTGFQRQTRQRSVILDELRRAHDHPTARELYERVQIRLPRISLGTVYRNLERLHEAGMIRKLEYAGQETRVDGDLEHHYHIRCTRCHRLDDVPEITSDLVGQRFEELGGYRVTGHRLEFQGLCPDCRNETGE